MEELGDRELRALWPSLRFRTTDLEVHDVSRTTGARSGAELLVCDITPWTIDRTGESRVPPQPHPRGVVHAELPELVGRSGELRLKVVPGGVNAWGPTRRDEALALRLARDRAAPVLLDGPLRDRDDSVLGLKVWWEAGRVLAQVEGQRCDDAELDHLVRCVDAFVAEVRAEPELPPLRPVAPFDAVLTGAEVEPGAATPDDVRGVKQGLFGRRATFPPAQRLRAFSRSYAAARGFRAEPDDLGADAVHTAGCVLDAGLSVLAPRPGGGHARLAWATAKLSLIHI